MIDLIVDTGAAPAPPPNHDQHFALPDEMKDPEVGIDKLKSHVNTTELKSEPKPSKEKMKKDKIKEKKEEKKNPPTKKNKTLWVAILVVSSIVLALSLIVFGLCISHKWMNASFIPALSG